MSKQINVTITSGSGTTNLANGTYTTSSTIAGYDNTTISPTTLNVVDGTNTYNLTLSATGSLILHVTETGESSGTPVIGATFYRTDSSGNEYGSIITTDQTGDAIFNNVPYSATAAPTIYFKQVDSDGHHTFTTDVQSTTLTTSTKTVEITNPLATERTINLTDANYTNLPLDGTITLTI